MTEEPARYEVERKKAKKIIPSSPLNIWDCPILHNAGKPDELEKMLFFYLGEKIKHEDFGRQEPYEYTNLDLTEFLGWFVNLISDRYSTTFTCVFDEDTKERLRHVLLSLKLMGFFVIDETPCWNHFIVSLPTSR